MGRIATIFVSLVGFAAGYGLREAVQALPKTITERDAPIIASMTADSCRRANFYAVDNLTLVCADAPALENQGVVYVLVEQFTGINDIVDKAEALGAETGQIAVYPRSGADSQPVTLWKLTRR